MQPLLDSFQRHLPSTPAGTAGAQTIAPAPSVDAFGSTLGASAAGANLFAAVKSNADKNLNKIISGMSNMKMPPLPAKGTLKPNLGFGGTSSPAPSTGGSGSGAGASS